MVGFCFLAPSGFSEQAASTPFHFILINDEDAEKFGGFPLPRARLAEVINNIGSQKPRSIILKFFIDLPKDSVGDNLLAEAISKFKVVLQARIDDTEANPNPFPPKFYLSYLPAEVQPAHKGSRGWIPLQLFAEKAADIGFVDLPSPRFAPLVEQYDGKYVKSLYLCALELATSAKARVKTNSVVLGNKTLGFTNKLHVPVVLPPPDTLVFDNLSTALHPASGEKPLQDKVVILGYDGSKMPKIKTSSGEMKAHRYFCLSLLNVYNQLK